MLFLKVVLATLGSLYLYINFRISVSISFFKKQCVDIEIMLELWINLGRMNTLTILSLLIHKYRISLHLSGSSLISYLAMFCSFQFKGIADPLTNLSLNMSCFWCYCFFSIPISDYLLLVYRNMMDFYPMVL